MVYLSVAHFWYCRTFNFYPICNNIVILNLLFSLPLSLSWHAFLSLLSSHSLSLLRGMHHQTILYILHWMTLCQCNVCVYVYGVCVSLSTCVGCLCLSLSLSLSTCVLFWELITLDNWNNDTLYILYVSIHYDSHNVLTAWRYCMWVYMCNLTYVYTIILFYYYYYFVLFGNYVYCYCYCSVLPCLIL